MRWTLEGDFLAGQYSRVHDIDFDGVSVKGSASLHNVPAPFAIAEAADPEELFVAAISTCHMLWFLDIACRAGWVVDDYCDDASGLLAADGRGRLAMTCVTLRPRVCFGGDHRPDAAQIRRLHDDAHEACFIANSVRTELRCEPVIESI